MRLGALVWMPKPSDPKRKVRPALVVYVGDNIVGLSFGATSPQVSGRMCLCRAGDASANDCFFREDTSFGVDFVFMELDDVPAPEVVFAPEMLVAEIQSLVPDMAARIDEETKRLLKLRAVEATVRRGTAAVVAGVVVADEAVPGSAEEGLGHHVDVGEGAASGEPGHGP